MKPNCYIPEWALDYGRKHVVNFSLIDKGKEGSVLIRKEKDTHVALCLRARDEYKLMTHLVKKYGNLPEGITCNT